MPQISLSKIDAIELMFKSVGIVRKQPNFKMDQKWKCLKLYLKISQLPALSIDFYAHLMFNSKWISNAFIPPHNSLCVPYHTGKCKQDYGVQRKYWYVITKTIIYLFYLKTCTITLTCIFYSGAHTFNLTDRCYYDISIILIAQQIVKVNVGKVDAFL